MHVLRSTGEDPFVSYIRIKTIPVVCPCERLWVCVRARAYIMSSAPLFLDISFLRNIGTDKLAPFGSILGEASQLIPGFIHFCRFHFHYSFPHFPGFTQPLLARTVQFLIHRNSFNVFFCILNTCPSHLRLLILTSSLA